MQVKNPINIKVIGKTRNVKNHPVINFCPCPSRYDISQNRVKKIYDYRTKKSKFQQLEDCLQLDGFGEKILDKFYDSILGNKVKRVERRLASVVSPKLLDEFRTTIRTCCALNVSVNSISWSRIEIESDRQFKITEWNHFPIDHKKFQTHELAELALKVSRSIPEADVYLMENPARAPTMMSNVNATTINVNVEKAQLIAMLSALLMNRTTTEIVEGFTTNLYFVKQFAAAKLFNTFVGNEKTSNNAVVMNLLGEDASALGWMNILTDLKMEPLIVADDVREQFFELGAVEREFIGQSLLLGLTFIKLGVQCDKN